MMRSAFDDEDDGDLFAPNPFRGNTDMLGAPNPSNQQPQQQQPYPYAQQPQYVQQPQYAQQPQQYVQQPQYAQAQPQYAQQPQYVQQPQFVNQPYGQQPDPHSGMTGVLEIPPPPVRAVYPDPAMYLSGTMDQGARAINNPNTPGAANYGGTDQVPSTSYSWFSWRTLAACCRLDSYIRYFDVDTIDIHDRIKAALVEFHLPDHFRTGVVGDAAPPDPNTQAVRDETIASTPIRKGPDLYGPFWISMTLVFMIAVTSNMSAYFRHSHLTSKHPTKTSNSTSTSGQAADVQEFEYDLHHFIRALSVVFCFVYGVPTAFWLATGCVGMASVPWVMWICCYGYSMVPYLAASFLAWIPWEIAHWTILAAATAASCLLVLRNLSNPLLSQDSAAQAKAAPFILSITATHFIYLLVLKFTFYP